MMKFVFFFCFALVFALGFKYHYVVPFVLVFGFVWCVLVQVGLRRESGSRVSEQSAPASKASTCGSSPISSYPGTCLCCLLCVFAVLVCVCVCWLLCVK